MDHTARYKMCIRDRYADIMYGLCYRYVSNPEDLRDVVHDGFIKVYDSIKRYKGDGSFEGWMKRLFINTAITFWKKSVMNNKTVRLDNLQLFKETADDDVRDGIDESDLDEGTVNYDIVSSAGFSQEELLQALQTIPEPFRMVFNLSCIEGMKHEEIGEMLGIDTSTSRTRLARARTMLQKELYRMCVKKVTTAN